MPRTLNSPITMSPRNGQTRVTRRNWLRQLVVAAVLFLFTGVLPTSASAAEDLIGIYLMWHRDPSTTMQVNWVDIYAKSDAQAWYRKQGTKSWTGAAPKTVAVGPSTLQRRFVEFTGLEPDTTYELSIGSKPGLLAKVSHRFRTMPATMSRPIRFVNGGDMMHNRAMADAMNSRAGKLDPDFALLGGDLAYANGVTATRWIDWLQSWTKNSVGKNNRLIPMVVGIGNHEVRRTLFGKGPEVAPYYYSLFRYPDDKAYFNLDFGKYLSLVVLDSGHTQSVTGTQDDWLEASLKARAEQKFLFACYHFPAYGTTKSPRGKLPIDNPLAVMIRKNWVPRFERYGLTAIFEHDHHNFKRSHRIRNEQRDDENGLLYLGDGAWGVKTRDVPKEGTAWWLAKAASRNHLFLVTINPDGTAKAEAHDAAGTIFDSVEISRPRTKPVEASRATPSTSK